MANKSDCKDRKKKHKYYKYAVNMIFFVNLQFGLLLLLTD